MKDANARVPRQGVAPRRGGHPIQGVPWVWRANGTHDGLRGETQHYKERHDADHSAENEIQPPDRTLPAARFTRVKGAIGTSRRAIVVRKLLRVRSCSSSSQRLPASSLIVPCQGKPPAVWPRTALIVAPTQATPNPFHGPNKVTWAIINAVRGTNDRAAKAKATAAAGIAHHSSPRTRGLRVWEELLGRPRRRVEDAHGACASRMGASARAAWREEAIALLVLSSECGAHQPEEPACFFASFACRVHDVRDLIGLPAFEQVERFIRKAVDDPPNLLIERRPSVQLVVGFHLDFLLGRPSCALVPTKVALFLLGQGRDPLRDDAHSGGGGARRVAAGELVAKLSRLILNGLLSVTELVLSFVRSSAEEIVAILA